MTIWTLATNPRLKLALARQCEEGLHSPARDLSVTRDAVTPGDVVITTDRDCPISRCSALIDQGAEVVVLAPWRAPNVAEAYAAAGCFAFLTMDSGPAALRESVRLASEAAAIRVDALQGN